MRKILFVLFLCLVGTFGAGSKISPVSEFVVDESIHLDGLSVGLEADCRNLGWGCSGGWLK